MPSESKKKARDLKIINFIENNVRLSRLKVDSLKIDLSKSRLLWSRFRSLNIFNSENLMLQFKKKTQETTKNLNKIVQFAYIVHFEEDKQTKALARN
ncbi:hypothetical protein BpHYR1_012603 [Brachionus plicatilis]|uniref:Uncharacterized protein n=1 Tax=Brachionus plicatilis TaxID=10195 RepID=A0A3M7Q990_BRAPC|nr:hypothetical protein BpHYR1_012603 [Brachionus plicatilis]